MADERRSFDWRLIAAWMAFMAVSIVAHTYVDLTDKAHIGVGLGHVAAIEILSHVTVAALLPAMYWLHRRWPLSGGLTSVMVHALAIVPFSLAHTLGMGALRIVWFVGILGETYKFPLTVERLGYEFSKDVVAYVLLSAGILALNQVLHRNRPSPAPASGSDRPERFAVRRRGGNEVMVEVADIDWIEASGNYAILHVGGETFEIRSSLTRLEGELDSRRFVRVHKSHVVNISCVTEVTPWVSGDWRIRLQDGAEVNLSRRYRQRFEALAPVRS